MPPESLFLAVTSGLGVGIFAGLVSGVCYIVVTGFASKRSRSSTGPKWHCTICGTPFRTLESLLESGRVVKCTKCGANVCRGRCSKLLKDVGHQKIGWVCQTCQHPESWFKGILRTLQPSLAEGKSNTKMEPARIDEVDEDLDEMKKSEKQHVRDFIERLVEAMLGSSIDSANVTRMYNDQKYLPILGQTPCSAHASLKLLIQKIIQEAIGLPTLEKNNTEIEMTNGEAVNHTYEDLLATAILNKVVENYQDELGASRTNSVSSRMSNSSVYQNDKEYYFGTETLNSKWRNGVCSPVEIDGSSVSSLEDWVRSDSSVGSTKYVDHVSLKIQQRIEEVSSTDDEAQVTPVLQETLTLPENEWQENWLMQKRSFGSASPVPVPMLVPHPSSEAKVLIGDREADDTTDLSDAGSDIEETESSQSIEHILTNSKTVIGGKNLLSDLLQEDENHEQENLTVTGIEDNSLMSFESQTEQDTEYTEKYATLPRTILISPTPITEKLLDSEKEISSPIDEPNKEILDDIDGDLEIEIIPKHNGYHHQTEAIDDEQDNDTKANFEGNYSKREKEKWNNAIEMKNNPYSSENLKRRLSDRSSSSISSLFSKDYSIKDAIKLANSEVSSTENLPIINDTPVVNTKESAGSLSVDCIFMAKPAVIQSDDYPDTDVSSIEVASPIPSSTIEVSSDSDLSIERVYNLPTGNVYVNGKINEVVKNDHLFQMNNQQQEDLQVPSVEEESIEKCMDFSLEFSTDESLQNTIHEDNSITTDPELQNTIQEENSITTDPEITELCDKHLVKDLLGQFSKSYPSLTSQIKNDTEQQHHENESPPHPAKNNNFGPVYSLTARSIPREFREELRKTEDAPRSSSSHAILMQVQPEELLPFPIAKSKIKFFESLK